jgi:Uma2 family endonuclease
VDWEGYLNLPDDLTHYEIIDGEVIPLASPTLKHQMVSRELFKRLDALTARAGSLGQILYAPFDFVVRVRLCARASLTCFSSRANGFSDWAQLQEQPRLEFAPTW